MSHQAEIEHGKRIAAQAEHVWRRDSRSGKRRLENRARLFHEFVAGPPAPNTILEIGCGTGVWSEIVATLPGVELTSMDISEDLLQIARAKFPNGQVRFLRGEAERLPFPDTHFDCICGLSVLHHLDLPVTLREIRRVLKPGGKLWFSEPNMLNPQIMIQKNIPLIKRWSGDTPDETAFFRWPLARLLRQAGFSDVQIIPFDFLHPSVPAFATKAVDRWARWLEKLPGVREIAGSLLIQARRPDRV